MDLPTADQLELYAELTEFLGGPAGRETTSERETRLKSESLDAMRAAVRHLGLEEGEALKAKEFDRAARELESDWRAGQVIRLWGLWSSAQAALVGDEVPMTPAQRSIVIASKRGGKRPAADQVAGVRTWLDTRPASETMASYEAFQRAHNDKLPKGEPRLLTAGHLTSNLGLPWAAIKDVARGKLSLDDAFAARARPTKSTSTPWGELVGGWAVAEKLGVPFHNLRYRSGRPDFPPAVARVGGSRVWRRVDIETYASGGREYLTKEEGELDEEILGSGDMRSRLGLSPRQLYLRVAGEQWDKIPRPEGRIGENHWWSRSSVEEWERSKASA